MNNPEECRANNPQQEVEGQQEMAASSAAMDGVAAAALRSVLQRVQQAAERAGRQSQRIRVVAVSKTKPVSLLRQVYDAGHRCFGENYVQELVEKAPQLPDDIEWHFIGNLQSNKVKPLVAAVPNLAMVETVDDEKIANHLNRAVGNLGRKPLKVLVQVNTSGEESKSGVEPSGCVELARHVALSCPNLEFCGLMTIGMPDYTSTPENFKTLANCRSEVCKALGIPEEQCELSMGMSGDFELAIILRGFSSDSYTASSLINFYAKFGHTENARKVFDETPSRDVVPWTAIIGCHCRGGDVENAFSTYNEMRCDGVEPSPVTFLSLLSGALELAHVQALHGCVVLYGFESDIALGNSLLNSYSKCGSIEEARGLFELMDQRDKISWNSLISGYAQLGNAEKILQLVYRMKMESIRPDQQSFASLVTAVAAQGKLDLGKVVHGQILRCGFDLDAHVETALMVMYLKCGNTDAGYKIFEGISEKDVVLWTAMISGLVQTNCADKALIVFHQMLKSRVEPSTATITSALAACAQLGSFDLGTSIHAYILRQGLAIDIPAQNSLVTMYAKCGYLEHCSVVFEGMDEKDLVSWNAIIAGYAKNDQLSKALLFFNKMRLTLQKPDSLTVVALLQASASTGALHQGKWLHSFVIRNCLRPCILVDTALVDMYCKCGDLDTAVKCFGVMVERDLISWSTIIGGYGSHGKGEKALSMYFEFLKSGMEPNKVIFLSIMSACSHNGLVDQGLRIFQSMARDFGVQPEVEHHACIVDLLCRAGRVEEAYNFYKGNFSEPSVDVLSMLLDACRANNKLELCDVIAQEVITLRPASAGNYVQIAHCYASMSRWNDVGKALTEMRFLGLRKLPGWSFIDLQDPTSPAAFLRLLFHDCQVQGCDASILLETGAPRGHSEMVSGKNFGIRKRETIEQIKYILEAECPGQVSCADIIALAAKESVALSGGPNIQIPLGRKDSITCSRRAAETHLPSPDITVDQLLKIFMSKGLNMEESVAILGGHTLGGGHCINIVGRLYDRQRNDQINPGFEALLRFHCPTNFPLTNLTVVPNDKTPLTFDNQYFRDVLIGKGLFAIDSSISRDPRTSPIVRKFAADVNYFFHVFSSAFVKLSSANVLTKGKGEVRRRCNQVN
ncbi:Plant peroxidase [Corchorus capsularis]|uniref:Pyridoxal phosphate homeostasis protein n=1 Tax=Corchorus capsularis TaxID=210143 RepID=A0A1R3I2W2_COCAP|nr:Plant peroxidase [Corchorus capsularis]